MKETIEWILDLDPNQVLAWAMVISLVAHKLFEKLGWIKAALVLDEVREGLEKAKPYLIKASKLNQLPTITAEACKDLELNIEKATKQAAAHIKGVDAKDLDDMIKTLISYNAVEAKGVAITLNADGDLSVDPSGAIKKYSSKVGKWFKKVIS